MRSWRGSARMSFAVEVFVVFILVYVINQPITLLMQTKLQRNFVALIIAVLTTVIFLTDCFTTGGISDWVWYFVPLLLLVFVRNSFSPFLLAVILSALMVAGYFFSPAGSTKWWMPIVNRSMGICVIWLVAWVLSQLQKTEERLRTQSELLDLAHDAVLVRDLDDRILYWNKSAERIFGWAAREIFGKKSLDLLGTGDNTFAEAKRSVLEKGKWSGELVCRTKDGHDVTVDARWTLVRDHHGAPKSILSINTDITEKQKLQQQILRSQPSGEHWHIGGRHRARPEQRPYAADDIGELAEGKSRRRRNPNLGGGTRDQCPAWRGHGEASAGLWARNQGRAHRGQSRADRPRGRAHRARDLSQISAV
jgi:PAS domain S-box-containing protein